MNLQDINNYLTAQFYQGANHPNLQAVKAAKYITDLSFFESESQNKIVTIAIRPEVNIPILGRIISFIRFHLTSEYAIKTQKSKAMAHISTCLQKDQEMIETLVSDKVSIERDNRIAFLKKTFEHHEYVMELAKSPWFAPAQAPQNFMELAADALENVLSSKKVQDISTDLEKGETESYTQNLEKIKAKADIINCVESVNPPFTTYNDTCKSLENKYATLMKINHVLDSHGFKKENKIQELSLKVRTIKDITFEDLKKNGELESLFEAAKAFIGLAKDHLDQSNDAFEIFKFEHQFEQLNGASRLNQLISIQYELLDRAPNPFELVSGQEFKWIYEGLERQIFFYKDFKYLHSELKENFEKLTSTKKFWEHYNAEISSSSHYYNSIKDCAIFERLLRNKPDLAVDLISIKLHSDAAFKEAIDLIQPFEDRLDETHTKFFEEIKLKHSSEPKYIYPRIEKQLRHKLTVDAALKIMETALSEFEAAKKAGDLSKLKCSQEILDLLEDLRRIEWSMPMQSETLFDNYLFLDELFKFYIQFQSILKNQNLACLPNEQIKMFFEKLSSEFPKSAIQAIIKLDEEFENERNEKKEVLTVFFKNCPNAVKEVLSTPENDQREFLLSAFRLEVAYDFKEFSKATKKRLEELMAKNSPNVFWAFLNDIKEQISKHKPDDHNAKYLNAASEKIEMMMNDAKALKDIPTDLASSMQYFAHRREELIHALSILPHTVIECISLPCTTDLVWQKKGAEEMCESSCTCEIHTALNNSFILSQYYKIKENDREVLDYMGGRARHFGQKLLKLDKSKAFDLMSDNKVPKDMRLSIIDGALKINHIDGAIKINQDFLADCTDLVMKDGIISLLLNEICTAVERNTIESYKKIRIDFFALLDLLCNPKTREEQFLKFIKIAVKIIDFDDASEDIAYIIQDADKVENQGAKDEIYYDLALSENAKKDKRFEAANKIQDSNPLKEKAFIHLFKSNLFESAEELDNIYKGITNKRGYAPVFLDYVLNLEPDLSTNSVYFAEIVVSWIEDPVMRKIGEKKLEEKRA